MNKVLEKTLRKINTKRIDAEISKIYSDLKKKLESAISYNCEIFLGGSLAKGTMLANNKELDIFIRFSKEYKNKELSDMLEAGLKKAKIKYKRVHGSRDYFRSSIDDYTIEFIPIYKIDNASEAKNITDISPLHVLWVTKKINGLMDDVKLAKQFCKSGKIYGAESHIQGLSGYVLEILVIHYGGFEKLLQAATKWKDKTIIDVEKQYKNKNEILSVMNIAKIVSPLIVVDPVQKERNAAAALSIESYGKFISLAKEFLKEPSEDYFKIKEINEKELVKEAKKLKAHIVHLSIIAAGDKSDVIGGKVRKLKQFLEKNLNKKGFHIIKDYWTLKDIWLFYSPEKLPLTYEHRGPLVANKNEHYKKFITKHKDTFVKGKYVYANVKNKHRDIESCVKDVFNMFIKNYKKDIKITKITRLL